MGIETASVAGFGAVVCSVWSRETQEDLVLLDPAECSKKNI